MIVQKAVVRVTGPHPHQLKAGGGIHKRLSVRVCPVHMDVLLCAKLSKRGSLFRQIFLKHGLVFQKLTENSQNG